MTINILKIKFFNRNKFRHIIEMPKASQSRLAVANMVQCGQHAKDLATYWRDERKSKLTAHWVETLADYVNELVENDKFMNQMYDHLAAILYTMDTAPNHAIVAFAHLANMGSLTTKLKKLYDWDDQAIQFVQQRQNVKPKEAKFKTFQSFLQRKNQVETTQFFQRLLGSAVTTVEPTQTTSEQPYTAPDNPDVEISEEDNHCLALAADILTMESDSERLFNLGGQVNESTGLLAQPADVDDIMSLVSYQTSRSSRIMSAFQDQKIVDINVSQIDFDADGKLTLPIQTDDDGKPMVQALIEDQDAPLCQHWDPVTMMKCEEAAQTGQYWCNEHQHLIFDRSDDFLKELKGFNNEIVFNLSQSMQVENHNDAIVLPVFQYATSYDGPTDTFIHGRVTTEKILEVAYQVHLANPSGDFLRFNPEPYKATFKEKYTVIYWYHIHMSVRSQMIQVKHPLDQPWVNTIPLLSVKLGGAQGFVDPTKALCKLEWFDKRYPSIETKMADDILQPNPTKIKGMIL